MTHFNKEEFGENIKKNRLAKGLSQENLANTLHKNVSTISRYESGELIPDAEEISEICEELSIYEYDLFKSQNANIQNKIFSKNPFGTNTLFMYFNAYNYRTKKFGKGKYKLLFTEKPDMIKVEHINLYDNKAYSVGYALADDSVCFIVLENNKSISARLDVCQIEINICNGVDGLMLGSFYGTNSQYIPSLRKCYFSKDDIPFTDKMFDELKVSNNEMQTLKKQNALYLDIFN